MKDGSGRVATTVCMRCSYAIDVQEMWDSDAYQARLVIHTKFVT